MDKNIINMLLAADEVPLESDSPYWENFDADEEREPPQDPDDWHDM